MISPYIWVTSCPRSRAACFLARALAISAFVATALVSAPGRADDGGASCASSGDCAAPTPHCNTTSHTCVACLSNRNCPSNGICDLATGTCKQCLADSDCAPDRPYCDVANGRCVECKTDENCGTIGLSCNDGACGSCGDGICAPLELAYFARQHLPFTPDDPNERRVSCAADCSSQCPTKDIGSTLGTFSVDGAGLRNLYSTTCDGVDGVEATFAWTAPRTDNFQFTASGYVDILPQGCAGNDAPQSCYSGSLVDGGTGGPPMSGTTAALTEGQHVIILVDSMALHVDTVTLEIAKGPPSCGFFGCPPPPPPESDASPTGPSDQETAACLTDADKRGEEKCDGLECVCGHCPLDYDECAKTPGCGDVRTCMQNAHCLATECYNSGACRSLIDSKGGLSGDAFRAAANVASCELTFGCELPCGEKPVTDAGVSNVDAGRLCAPGREVTCECDGGTGTKVCAQDGSGFGACQCNSDVPKPAESSSCDCTVGRGTPAWPRGAAIALAAMVACCVRRRRRPRRFSTSGFPLLLTLLAFAGRARANDAGSCATSADCFGDTSHCHPTLHTCVECTTDRNCPMGRVCDATSGSCKVCLSDLDCTNEKPYCDTSRGQCIECVTDKNCGSSGLSCVNGSCGKCGDGICAPREGLYFDPIFLPSGQVLPAKRTACAEDCGHYCPTKDIGNTLGAFTTSGAGLANMIDTGCNAVDGVEATFAWKAPRDDLFAFRATAGTLVIFRGSCSRLTLENCGISASADGGPSPLEVTSSFKKDDEVVIAVDTGFMSVASVEIEIAKGVPSCGLFGCPPPQNESDASGEAAAAKNESLCLDNAKDRGELRCDGLDCACHNCPRDYDDCAVIPGCRAVEACISKFDCSGDGCYDPHFCRGVIDTYGGTKGSAFRVAASVRSCEKTFECKLPCAQSDAGHGAGHDGGTDGSFDGGPDDARDTPIPFSSACDCRAARSPSSEGNALGAVGALVLGAVLRSRSRPRAHARKGMP